MIPITKLKCDSLHELGEQHCVFCFFLLVPFYACLVDFIAAPFVSDASRCFYSLSLMMWRKTEGCEEFSNALSSETIDTKIARLTPFSLPTSISGKGERSIKLCCNTKENPSIDRGRLLFFLKKVANYRFRMLNHSTLFLALRQLSIKEEALTKYSISNPQSSLREYQQIMKMKHRRLSESSNWAPIFKYQNWCNFSDSLVGL